MVGMRNALKFQLDAKKKRLLEAKLEGNVLLEKRLMKDIEYINKKLNE